MKVPIPLDPRSLLPFKRAGEDLMVGIDFSSHTLRFLTLRVSPHKVEVTRLVNRPIGGLSDEEIAKTIRAAAAELKLANATVIDVLASSLVITKNIEIPSTNPSEIKEIIGLQAGRHTPYSREEIIVDYIDIGTFKRSYTKILLVIIARHLVKRHFEVLERAGLKLEQVHLAVEGVSWAIPNLLKIDCKDAPLGFLHIDEQSTDFAVVLDAKPLFIRSIPIGIQQLLDDPVQVPPKFAEEVKSSLESYQGEDIERPVQAVLVTGAVEELKNLTAVMAERVHVPVRSVSYARSVTFGNEAFNRAGLIPQVSFLGVISCVCASRQMRLNLIPEEVRLRKALEERGRELMKAGILCLSVFVLIFCILLAKIVFSNAYLKRLGDKYQPLMQEASQLDQSFGRLSFIRNYLMKRGLSVEVLRELHSLVNDDIRLSDIRLDEQGRCTIRGSAESMSVVFSLMEDMEKSRFFDEVKTKYTTKRREGSRDVTDFEIVSLTRRGL